MNMKRSFALFAFIALAASAAAAVESLRDLGPKLASDQEETRTAAQREMQSMLSHACMPGAEADRAALAKLRNLDGYTSAPYYIYSGPARNAPELGDTDAFFFPPQPQ